MPGGRQDETPGTLSQENRGRWKAGQDTWYAFAGIPCQVDGGKGHLERFRGDSVPGGRQDETPGTLSQENRARWAAGKDTWNCQNKNTSKNQSKSKCQSEGRAGQKRKKERDSLIAHRQ